MAPGDVYDDELNPDHQFGIRIYYEDTDAGGIVYYANYLKFAERARTEMLRHLGFSHAQLIDDYGLACVVRRCAVDYRHPARLDDGLMVHTHVAEIRGASFDLRQRILRDGIVTADLNVTLATVDQSGRARRLPTALIAALRPQCGT